jgi:hypothetical protein
MISFDTLYDIYNSGNLVIIVGSETLKVRDCLTLEQAIIERITKNKFVPGSSPRSYSELAVEYPNVTTNVLTGKYNEFKSTLDKRLLNTIAGFSKVNLFIQTTFDTELEEMFGDRAEPLIWNHEKKDPLYLNQQNEKKKIIYLYGNINEEISIFEEEQIEALFSIVISNERNKSTGKDRYSFLEFLTKKTLVFIGNNFSDAIMRLMIRTLYNAPVTAKNFKAYIVNDQQAGIEYKKYFYKKFNIELIHEYPIANFLNDFRQKIREKEGFNNKYEPLTVFISYDHDSSTDIARELVRRLNDKNIAAFFDESMGITEHEQKIADSITNKNTLIFVCFISQTLAKKTAEQSYTKRVEWRNAEDRYNVNEYLQRTKQKADPFTVIPVACDDFKQYVDELPAYIRKQSIQKCTLDDLADNIEKIIIDTYNP